MVVVLVDDDVDDLELFCDAVMEIDRSIDCLCFSSGTDLLIYLADPTHTPDFIFVDLILPAISGVDCICEIRKIQRCDNTRLIVYANHIRLRDFATIGKLNVMTLIKPDSYDILVHEVRRIISGNES